MASFNSVNFKRQCYLLLHNHNSSHKGRNISSRMALILCSYCGKKERPIFVHENHIYGDSDNYIQMISCVAHGIFCFACDAFTSYGESDIKLKVNEMKEGSSRVFLLCLLHMKNQI